MDFKRVLIEPLLFGELSVFPPPTEPLAEPDDPTVPPASDQTVTPGLASGRAEPEFPSQGLRPIRSDPRPPPTRSREFLDPPGHQARPLPKPTHRPG